MDDCKYCGAHLGPGEVCDCALSKYNRLTPENKRKADSFAFALVDSQSRGRDNEPAEEDRKFLNQFHKADTAEKIVTVAIMCSGSEEDGLDMVEGYTRSDFKMAIKRLRECQRQYPDYSTCYEEAIGHIRRVWLHKEEPAGQEAGGTLQNYPNIR